MNNENNVLNKNSEREKTAHIILGIGIFLICVAFIIAKYVFEYCEGYESFGFGYGGLYYWCVIYDTFSEYLISEFFNFNCYYGYIALLGIIMIIIGCIIKYACPQESKENVVEMRSDSNNTVIEGSNIEKLKQYKELFDLNIISEEEFEAKKKELL